MCSIKVIALKRSDKCALKTFNNTGGDYYHNNNAARKTFFFSWSSFSWNHTCSNSMKEIIICRNDVLQVYLNKNRTIVLLYRTCMLLCKNLHVLYPAGYMRTPQLNYFATTVSLNKLLIIYGETTVKYDSMLQTTNDWGNSLKVTTTNRYMNTKYN